MTSTDSCGPPPPTPPATPPATAPPRHRRQPTTASQAQLVRERDLAVALCSAQDLPTAAAAVLRACIEIGGIDSGALHRLDARQGDLALEACEGLREETVAAIGRLDRDSLLASFVRSRRPVHGHYARLGLATSPLREAEGLRAVSLLPLSTGRRLVGCLSLGSHLHDELSPETRGAAEALGAVASRGLERLLVATDSGDGVDCFRHAVDLLPAAVFEVDALGNIEFLNRSALEQSGYDRQDLETGLRATDMVIESDRQRVSDNIARAIGGADAGATEYVALRKNGEQFPCVLRSSRVQLGCGRIGLRGVIIDISERRAVERDRERLAGQLEQAMMLEATGRLAGGVAHDFNNLLTTVLGYASLGQITLEPSHPVGTMLREIQKAAEAGAQVTQQLLAFSSRQAVAPRPLDLNAVVTESRGLVARVLGEGVELRIDLAPEVAPVMADGLQLQQILVNLAVNSRDALAEGGKVTIRTGSERSCSRWREPDRDQGGSSKAPAESSTRATVEPESGTTWIEFTDDGMGMDEFTQSHAFEPFFTTKARGRGTGLGLAMVYGAVRQHGGVVAIESQEGKGTTVTLRYPSVEPSAMETEADAVGGLAEHPGRGEQILIVEDEDLVRDMVERVLSRLGYRVKACPDGASALHECSVATNDIDLLVTDVVLPGIHGPDLAERIRERAPRVAVLFTSGYSAETISRHGIGESGTHFLPKPYTPRQLAQKIRSILDER